jgi:hypothetical protein
LFVFHFISPISAEFICFFIYADTAFPYAKNLIFAQSSSALCLRQSRKKLYFSGKLIALAGFRFSEHAHLAILLPTRRMAALSPVGHLFTPIFFLNICQFLDFHGQGK